MFFPMQISKWVQVGFAILTNRKLLEHNFCVSFIDYIATVQS